MDTIETSEHINHNRLLLFGRCGHDPRYRALWHGRVRDAQSRNSLAELPAIKPGTNTSFGPLEQVDAGLLNVGYAEAGPAHGPAVVLLHGWPYDIHSYVDVAPLLVRRATV